MFRNTTPEDVAYVVQNMRPEDVKELWLASGTTAAEAVAALGEKPYVAFTILKDDEPVAIFGATIDPDGVATMFRFATKHWPEVVREAVKIGRRVFVPLAKEARVKCLVAYPLANSDTRWLSLFGAKKIGGYMANGHHFHSFSLPLAA